MHLFLKFIYISLASMIVSLAEFISNVLFEPVPFYANTYLVYTAGLYQGVTALFLLIHNLL